MTPSKFEQLLELIRFPTISTKYLTGPLFTCGLLSVEEQHLVMCDAVNIQGQLNHAKRSKFSSIPRGVVPLVWFESRTGKTFTVEYDTDDSMQDLINRLVRVSGYPILSLEIFKIDEKPFDIDKAEPNSSIKNLGIFRESRLVYNCKSFLNLENDSGTQLSIKVREKDTIEDIRERVAMKLQQQQAPKQAKQRQHMPKRTDGRTTETLISPKSRSNGEKAKGTEATMSRNSRGDEIGLKLGGRSLLNSAKTLADENMKSGDTLRFTQRPADWKHRTASIKFKISARSLFGEKRESVRMSKPKIVDSLQWMAETYCKDGENVELFLYCGGEDQAIKAGQEKDKNSDWKCIVHFAEFKIRNWRAGVAETRRGWDEPAEFNPRGKCKWGFAKFIKVTKIQEHVNDYVNENGQLQFEIDFYPERIQARI